MPTGRVRFQLPVMTMGTVNNRHRGLGYVPIFQDCITPTHCPSRILRTTVPIAVTRPRVRMLRVAKRKRMSDDSAMDPRILRARPSQACSRIWRVVSQREVRCLLLVLRNASWNFPISGSSSSLSNGCSCLNSGGCITPNCNSGSPVYWYTPILAARILWIIHPQMLPLASASSDPVEPWFSDQNNVVCW